MPLYLILITQYFILTTNVVTEPATVSYSDLPLYSYTDMPLYLILINTVFYPDY